jgi:hypothetical protein
MAKVIVKNFAEHDFDLPGVSSAAAPGGAASGLIKFPRLGIRTGMDGVGIETPGEVEVDSAVIERMKGHPVTASWLKNDHRGRPQLVVEAVTEGKEADKGQPKK